jgi:Pregnancy-associated plasma protein-A/Secretion system C-terminal sorting domain
MKKITLLSFLFLLITSFNYAQEKKQKKTQLQGIKVENINPENGMVRCATSEYEELLRQRDPKRLSREQFDAFLAPFIEQYNNTPANASQSFGVISIPVVVHVIHNGDAYGTNENITDAQVQSQITVMTQDFRRMINTPGYNTNAVGADTQIQFVLAKVDPNGNPTNGINRVNLCRDNYNVGSFPQIQALIDSEVKPQTIWDPTLYMNMWSVNWDGSGLLGYAQFPSTGTATANTDGVVAGHSYFGSRTLFPAGTYGDTTYDKGRTMTHEVGHFLGLYHTFQGGCNGAGDNCADTPSVDTENYGCPTGHDSCTIGSPDMIENYMDYTDDSCMNIFTVNQKAIITSVMNSSPRRSTLKTSTKDLAIPLFANDAEVKIENICGGIEPSCSVPNPTAPAKVISLYNRGTATMTSATISYNMNGGTNFTNSWTGSLAPNAFAYITLANTTTNGTLNVSITNVNGVADARATNNTASKTFGGSSGSGLAYANATSFTFNLVGDRWGSETSWTLKNQAGVTLYSGGPYTDTTVNGTQPLVTNQSWTLPANGCYYLTVTDSYGDGLFDGTGQGYYTVNAGATSVVNVSNFVAAGNPPNTSISRVSYFTNNSSLNNTSFDFTGDIFVYPNPSRNELNISLPNGLELPKSLTITNSLGQSIMTRKVENNDNLNINTSSLSNGIYFITISNENYTKTLRFIKE